MSDAKGNYSTDASKKELVAEQNEALKRKKESAIFRASSFKQNWESVDINKVVDKFVPDYYTYNSNGKMVFSNGGRYIVYADSFGGYLRIYDNECDDYITLDGTPSRKLPKSIRESATHFSILKRKDMK